MRTKNSIINMSASLLTCIIVTLNSLIIPKVLGQLGPFTLGLNNAFLNTASLMNIVDLGIGIAIVYNLYEPIAKKDSNKIAVILKFYKNTYKIIACIILGLGLIICFIVPSFLDKDALAYYNRSWVSLAFLFYVGDVLASYLFAHKRAMLTADQKNYMNNICRAIGVTISCGLQILSLHLFHSFLIYATVKIAGTILENALINFCYNSRYKHINLKTKEKFPSKEKNALFKNLKALLLHKIATVALKSTPNLVMSSINTIISGYYSVYMFIVNGVLNVTEQVFNGITASMGNLLVTSSKKAVFSRFKVIYFLNHMIYSFLCVAFFNCITPFITLYYGKSWLMSNSSVIIILIYMYIVGMRQSLLLVKISAGIYRQDRYFAVLEASLNIVLTILMGKIWGINGILSASIVSMILVPMWTQPYIVYKDVFDEKLSDYYKRLFIYSSLTAIYIVLTVYVSGLIKVNSLFLDVIIRGLISVIVPNCLNALIFWKREEMVFGRNLISSMLKRKT